MRIALVLGGAASVEADVEAALALGEYSGVIAANDAGAHWPGPLDGVCSIHADRLARIWLPARQKRGYPKPGMAVGTKSAADRRYTPPLDGFTDHLFLGQIHSGSSGLFALKLALIDLGFDRAVLCGIPMTETPHFFRGQPWKGAKSHKRGWQEAFPAIRDRARSLSGWTAELLRGPTAEWVAGEPDYKQHDLGERGAA